MTTPRLRTATRADEPVIESLMKASISDIFPRFYDERQTQSSVQYVGVPDRALIDDGTYYVLEEVGGEVVACGGWSRRGRLYTGSGHAGGDERLLDPATEAAHVRAMFVRSDWTRRGLGRRILEACEAAAKREGFRTLDLMGTLPGIALYGAYGFRELERTQVTMPDGVTIECAAMVRPIGWAQSPSLLLRRASRPPVAGAPGVAPREDGTHPPSRCRSRVGVERVDPQPGAEQNGRPGPGSAGTARRRDRGGGGRMATATDVSGEIQEVLTRFADAYEAKDLAGVLGAFAPECDVQLVGTGADEVRLGLDAVREQAERDFSQADRMSISFGELHVDRVDDVAWALTPCAVRATIGGESVSFDLRLTAVLERRDDAWLIRQVHLSAPMAGQDEGQSFPTT